MLTTFDIETTFQIKEWGTDPSPYDPNNYMVSIGWKNEREREGVYLCASHVHHEQDHGIKQRTQEMLDATSLLVAHNIKFDLSWLFELGYVYKGQVWDTMIAEYVLARGRKISLKLGDCCTRRGLPTKSSELVEDYIHKGISFQYIPWEIIEEYGRQDVIACEALALAQMKELGYVYL